MRRNFELGERVGPYRLDAYLGGGGFGQVWQASSDDGVVALKLLDPDGGLSSDAYEMFRRERDAANRIDSGRVARVVDSNLTGDVPYIAFPLLPGANLGDYTRRQADQVIPLDDAISIFGDVAKGLAAIHAAGIVHRDIKPANIMVIPSRGAVIVDLGVAILGEGSDITRAGWGTDGFRAPEQIWGVARGHALDVWSFGATLVKAATGHLAFAPTSDLLAYDRSLREVPDLTGCPESLFDLALRCLDYEPAARPTATELGDAFAVLRGGLTANSLPRKTAVRVELVETLFVKSRLQPMLTVKGSDRTHWIRDDWDWQSTPGVGEWAVVPNLRKITPWENERWPDALHLGQGIRPFDSDTRARRMHPAAPRKCPGCGSDTQREWAFLYCSRPKSCSGAQAALLEWRLNEAAGDLVGYYNPARRAGLRLLVEDNIVSLEGVLTATSLSIRGADDLSGGSLSTAINRVRVAPANWLLCALVGAVQGGRPSLFKALFDWAQSCPEDSTDEDLRRMLTLAGGGGFDDEVRVWLCDAAIGTDLRQLKHALLFVIAWHPRYASTI